MIRAGFRALLRRYGPQRWWPAESPFEVMAGAVLVQHAAWSGAERAVAALRKRRLLDPRRLLAVSPARLAALVRPAGSPGVKTRRLRALSAWLLAKAPGTPSRDELLSVHGIGEETADAILLYAYGRPEFVADAYARRVLARHGLAPEGAGYAAAKSVFERALPRDAGLFNEYHALLVAVGREHCRTEARCAGCPLERFLGKEKAPGLPAGGLKLDLSARPGAPRPRRRARPPRGSR
jgi:endonuclease-3 related protein